MFTRITCCIILAVSFLALPSQASPSNSLTLAELSEEDQIRSKRYGAAIAFVGILVIGGIIAAKKSKK